MDFSSDDDFEVPKKCTKYVGASETSKTGNIKQYTSLANALEGIEQYQLSTGTQYFSQWNQKDLNKNKLDLERKILFEDYQTSSIPRLEYNSIPFIIIARKTLECTHGVDHEKKKKEKEIEKRNSGHNDHNFVKSRFLTQNTKKMDCPSSIYLREIVFFPSYKIEKDSIHFRSLAKGNIKRDFQSQGHEIAHIRKFIVKFPHVSSHNGHFVGDQGGLTQTIHKNLIERINKLVSQGVNNVREMKRHLDFYVEDDLFHELTVPHKSSRQYFPKLKDIRNHMYKASVKLKFS